MKFEINDLLIIRDDESFYDGYPVIVKDIKNDNIDAERYWVYDFMYDRIHFGVGENRLEKPSNLEIENIQAFLKDFEKDYFLIKSALEKNIKGEKQ